MGLEHVVSTRANSNISSHHEWHGVMEITKLPENVEMEMIVNLAIKVLNCTIYLKEKMNDSLWIANSHSCKIMKLRHYLQPIIYKKVMRMRQIRTRWIYEGLYCA